VIIVLGLGIILTILNIYELHKMKESSVLQQASQPVVEGKTGNYAVKTPVVWIEGKKVHVGHGILLVLTVLSAGENTSQYVFKYCGIINLISGGQRLWISKILLVLGDIILWVYE
jgi:hypothetical protein